MHNIVCFLIFAMAKQQVLSTLEICICGSHKYSDFRKEPPMLKYILIIDEEEILKNIRMYFSENIVDIHHVITVQEALWKMQFINYCLIILNVPLSDKAVHHTIGN